MGIWNQLRNVRQHATTLGAVSFGCAFLLALFWPAGARVIQPIQFNHRKHVDAGIQCSDCHTRFSSSPWAGLPQVDVCLTCHEQPVTESREEAKIRDFAQQKQPVPWRQINQLPKHVYFSHRTHAVTKGISCTVCHGQMEKATAPPSAPLFTWTMTKCLSCHKQQNATQDCDGCHR